MLVQRKHGVIHTVLHRFQINIELLRLGGLDLQLFVDGGQLLVGGLQFFVGRFQFFVGSLHLLIGGLNFLVQRLHFLVGGFQLFHQRLQVLAGGGQFVFKLAVGDGAALFRCTFTAGRGNPFDTYHQQCIASGIRQGVHRKAHTTIGIKCLDMARTTVSD